MDPQKKGKDDVQIYERYYSSTMRRELHNKCTPPPKIVKHTGTIYGQDISNELHNRKWVSIEKQQHTQVVLDHHQYMVELIENIFMYPQDARESKEKVLIGTATPDADEVIALEYL